MGWTLAWPNSRPWMWTCVAVKLFRLGCWFAPVRHGAESALLHPHHQGEFYHIFGEGWGISPECRGQLCCEAWASSLAEVSRERQNQAFQGQRRARQVQSGPWISSCKVLMASVVAPAIDINTDPSFCRTTDLDMSLGSIFRLNITLAPVAAHVTQISMTPATAWLSDTNMVSDD